MSYIGNSNYYTLVIPLIPYYIQDYKLIYSQNNLTDHIKTLYLIFIV